MLSRGFFQLIYWHVKIVAAINKTSKWKTQRTRIICCCDWNPFGPVLFLPKGACSWSKVWCFYLKMVSSRISNTGICSKAEILTNAANQINIRFNIERAILCNAASAQQNQFWQWINYHSFFQCNEIFNMFASIKSQCN